MAAGSFSSASATATRRSTKSRLAHRHETLDALLNRRVSAEQSREGLPAEWRDNAQMRHRRRSVEWDALRELVEFLQGAGQGLRIVRQFRAGVIRLELA